MLSHSPHGWVRLLLAPASHYLFSLFQGTNGSQLWDTAFAIQAFLEVMHPFSATCCLGKMVSARECANSRAPAVHPLGALLCQFWPGIL